MNLSPLWIPFLNSNGFSAVHWSEVGDPKAPDFAIVNWAKSNDFIIFTNDLDFGAIMAASRFEKPSVLQVRSDSLLPRNIGDQVLLILQKFQTELKVGAFVSFDLKKVKMRILPI